MSNPIQFYFDFTSPYGYIASERIEALAERHGRELQWHPIVLGFIFKLTGSQPLLNYPLKGEYARRDIQRACRQYDIPFQLPEPFPTNVIAAARAVLWHQQSQADAHQSSALIHAIYRGYFADNRDIASADVLIDIAADCGIDKAALGQALGDDRVKALLKTATDDAIEKGVFGSPFVLVDGEPFWGQDRLEMLDDWLARGGW